MKRDLEAFYKKTEEKVEIKEREVKPGQCFNCLHGSFTSAMVKGKYLRCCKRCLEVYDVDAEKIVRKGKVEFKK